MFVTDRCHRRRRRSRRSRDTADASIAAPLRTVHAAAARVRQLLAQHPGADVVVSLLPGTHHVGDGPLTLGLLDGGRDGGYGTFRLNFHRFHRFELELRG